MAIALGVVLLAVVGIGGGAFLLLSDQGKQLTDSQRIQGKWKGSMDSLEFLSNGEYRAHAVLATHNGKWQILEGNRLKITMDARLLPDSEWRYEIMGDKLTLTDMRGNLKLEYQREK